LNDVEIKKISMLRMRVHLIDVYNTITGPLRCPHLQDSITRRLFCYDVMENGNGTEMGSGNGSDSGKCLIQVIIIQIKFYSVMLLDNVVGPFHTVLLKQLKLSNRAVTLH